MTEENKQSKTSLIISKPESFRGGILDTLVTRLSFGHFGVEMTATIGYKDEFSGIIFQGEAWDLATMTRKPVYVADESKNMHNQSFRIIKNSNNKKE